MPTLPLPKTAFDVNKVIKLNRAANKIELIPRLLNISPNEVRVLLVCERYISAKERRKSTILNVNFFTGSDSVPFAHRGG